MKVSKIVIGLALAVSMMSLVFPTVLACGKVTGGGQIAISGGVASFGFNAMYYTQRDVLLGEIQYTDHVTGDLVHVHPLTHLMVWEDNPGNKPWPMLKAEFEGPCTFNHEEGYYCEVYVEDNREPASPDYFSILVYRLSDSVVIVNEGADLLHGNIQIHKPPK